MYYQNGCSHLSKHSGQSPLFIHFLAFLNDVLPVHGNNRSFFQCLPCDFLLSAQYAPHYYSVLRDPVSLFHCHSSFFAKGGIDQAKWCVCTLRNWPRYAKTPEQRAKKFNWTDQNTVRTIRQNFPANTPNFNFNTPQDITDRTPCCVDRLTTLTCGRMRMNSPSRFSKRCASDPDFALIQCCSTW